MATATSTSTYSLFPKRSDPAIRPALKGQKRQARNDTHAPTTLFKEDSRDSDPDTRPETRLTLQSSTTVIQHALFCDTTTDSPQSAVTSHSLASFASNRTRTSTGSSVMTSSALSTAERPLSSSMAHSESDVQTNIRMRRQPYPNRTSSRGVCFGIDYPTEHRPLKSLPEEFDDSRSLAPPSYRSISSMTMRTCDDKKTPFASVDSETTSGVPVASIFPTYDHSKRQNEQSYQPSQTIQSEAAMLKHRCDLNEEYQAKRDLVTNGYQSTYDVKIAKSPHASIDDHEALWEISRNRRRNAAREVIFQLRRTKTGSVTIGDVAGRPVYTMQEVQPHLKALQASKKLSIRKSDTETPMSLPVTQVVLPYNTEHSCVLTSTVSIMPQQAAIDGVTSCIAGRDQEKLKEALGTLDPAVQAKEAVFQAESRYKCKLSRVSSRSDNPTVIMTSYLFSHPRLGSFDILASRQQSSRARPDVPARVELYPREGSGKASLLTKDTLIAIDYDEQSCLIDLARFNTLNEEYFLDSCISAVLAASTLEDEIQHAVPMMFEPPPKVPFKPERHGSRTSSISPRKLAKRMSFQRLTPHDPGHTSISLYEQVDIPFLAEGAMNVKDASTKAAAFVMAAGQQFSRTFKQKYDY